METIEGRFPEAPPGPRVQLPSVDGAMVPLPHGEWVVHTEELSHFSRLTDAEPFEPLAFVETHR